MVTFNEEKVHIVNLTSVTTYSFRGFTEIWFLISTKLFLLREILDLQLFGEKFLYRY